MPVEVTVSNEQSEHEVDADHVRQLACGALVAEGIAGDAELSVVFVDEATIAELNERYLGHAGPTDVLSFAIEDDPRAADGEAGPLLLGDVVICPAVAARNAPDHAGTYGDELDLLLVHGILHLLGHDHELDAEAEEMEARERELLAADAARRGGGPA